MRKVLLGIALALFVAGPVSAAPPSATGSISVNEPGPYAVGDVVTLTVEWDKLKGYEYPVVLEWCGYLTDPGYEGVRNYVYFRRWDDKGYDYPRSTGPEPVLLTTAGDCTFELWAYAGLKGPDGAEHPIAIGPTLHIVP